LDRIERMATASYTREASRGYLFAPDSELNAEPDEEHVYPDALLRLIDKPSGPEWFRTYLAGLDRPALASDDPSDRAKLTKRDPLLFALVYLFHHLHSVETRNKLSFAEFHLDILEEARKWIRRVRGPREARDAYVAPRGSGKSTWLFNLLPVWGAAHGWIKFIVAFSDSADQAKNHLATIRSEFDTNDLLIQDFPLLCEPKVRRTGGALGKKTVSARVDKIEQANDFVMVAKGSGTAARGLKVGKRRPDLIILDDIEPGEERYSPDVMRYRLKWMLETVFHLNEFARVIIVGTVTAPGSIMHQLVESDLHPGEDTPEWIEEQKIHVHYYAPILPNDDGTERSCWPAKWPLDYLKGIQHTREYKKEFLNQPVSPTGDFWSDDDFIYADLPTVYDILALDPAVSDTDSSHDTGVAIIGLYDPRAGSPMPDDDRLLDWMRGMPDQRRAVVKLATTVRLPPKKLREMVLWYVDQYPEIGLLRVESNQGKETWRSVFHDIPVRVELTWSKLPKIFRATRLLNNYQRGRVVHSRRLPRLEQEMCAYHGGDVDIIDAVEVGVRKFIEPPKQRLQGGTVSWAKRTPMSMLSGGDL
jgi:hypothetical protein